MERGGYRYERRRPETTALHRVMAEHLRRFEAEWTDEGEGRTLPGFVVGELSGYLECGVAARGFARLACESCGQRHLVAFSCGGRGFCPSCLGRAPVFHPAPGPTQGEVEDVVHRARIRILRYLERHGVVRVVAAPGEGERSLLGDEALGESDPLLARFLAAAAAGAAPAGPARKRGPVRLVVGAGVRAQPKGPLCAQDAGFNLHAATRVGASDRAGRERLCRYVLRPPLANDHLHLLPDGSVRLELKRPWSDGTTEISLAPTALIRGSRRR